MAVFIAARLTVPIENLNMWLELRVFVLPSPSQEGVSQQCVPLLCKFDFKLTGRKPRLYLYHFVKLRLTVLFVLIHVLTLSVIDCSFCLDTKRTKKIKASINFPKNHIERLLRKELASTSSSLKQLSEQRLFS